MLRTPIRQFYNPTLVYADQFDRDGFALIHYAGNSKVLNAGPGMKRSDITDGASNTILLGEVNGNFQPWGKPGNWRDPAAGINTPDGFGGAEASGGAQFLMVDGSVRFVSKDVDPQVLKALSTPAGGEKLPEDWGEKR
jgi:prepilin-type processing-associated H-X9-DG protein